MDTKEVTQSQQASSTISSSSSKKLMTQAEVNELLKNYKRLWFSRVAHNERVLSNTLYDLQNTSFITYKKN